MPIDLPTLRSGDSVSFSYTTTVDPDGGTSTELVGEPVVHRKGEHAMQPAEFLAERIAEAKAEIAKATPGSWKVWGMQVLADTGGDNDVDKATLVASTFCSNTEGRLRTWNADHMATWDPPRLLGVLEAYERILGLYERYAALLRPGQTSYSAQYVILGEVIIDLAYAWRYHTDWNPEWEVK